MSLDLYSLLSFFAAAIMIASLVLPALTIYFYASFKNHFALVLSGALLFMVTLIVKEHIIILLPFILPIIFTGLMGSILRKYGEEFWSSMGYVILAEMTGIIIGIVAIYLYYGMQDIAELLAEGFRNAFTDISPGNRAGTLLLNLMTQFFASMEKGAIVYVNTGDMTTGAKLDIVVPQIKLAMAGLLPSAIMGYGIISGVWAWFLSSVLITKRVADKKPLPGIKEYKPYPPFSEWKLPRWLTNVLMVLLLASIIISFTAQGAMLNAASALQTVAVVILSILGLSVVNWWLKKKKVAAVLNVVLCALIACISFIFNFVLPLIGLIDIMFSVRMSDKQRNAIKKRMEEIKKQVDEQMKELQDKKRQEGENKENDDENGENESNGQDESGDKK